MFYNCNFKAPSPVNTLMRYLLCIYSISPGHLMTDIKVHKKAIRVLLLGKSCFSIQWMAIESETERKQTKYSLLLGIPLGNLNFKFTPKIFRAMSSHASLTRILIIRWGKINCPAWAGHSNKSTCKMIMVTGSEQLFNLLKQWCL